MQSLEDEEVNTPRELAWNMRRLYILRRNHKLYPAVAVHTHIDT